MRIVLCDDHRLLVEALTVLLRSRGHETVSHALRPEEAADAVRRHEVDVCVMDLGFPDGNGLDGVAMVRAASPRTRVVVLSALNDPDMVTAALDNGASAYVLKGEETDRVVGVIERVGEGESGITPATLDGTARRPQSASEGEQLARFLTTREREVLERLARGQSTAAMAQEMGVAYSTARTHIQNVLTKLGVHSKLAAVTLAVQNDLVAVGGRTAAR